MLHNPHETCGEIAFGHQSSISGHNFKHFGSFSMMDLPQGSI